MKYISGGYKEEGAWTNTVEFFNFEKGAWTPFAFFPQLTNGRHYHGITTLGKPYTVPVPIKDTAFIKKIFSEHAHYGAFYSKSFTCI